jgi:hypothetical protein
MRFRFLKVDYFYEPVFYGENVSPATFKDREFFRHDPKLINCFEFLVAELVEVRNSAAMRFVPYGTR